MLSDWFKTNKDIDDFADSLVADLLKRFPPQDDKLPAKKAAERIRKTHGAILSRVTQFAQSTRLSLYRKARLANRVKWSLREAGYPERFVEAFTHELATVVAMASRQ
ncbi:MAG: hypothetical protein EPO27_02460 [Betaproteobacteria bacterium]|nr:MAG: hypothetical protein EPO27_02460 [Betaproteobacteria bacterium]